VNLVLCNLQVSEGRRSEVLDAILAAAREVDGVRPLWSTADPDHHRSDVAFAAQADVVGEAAFRAAAVAVREIDLNQHAGEHPRIGALDVLAFSPLEGTLADCVEIAYAAGERLSAELEIPVYFFGAAARRPERKSLFAVRRGGFEGLREALAQRPGREPDAGPQNALHPTAGATAVGAHPLPVAFEVKLESRDVELARRIARTVRERDGGLPEVQALALEVDHAGPTAVTVRLGDFERTGLLRVYEEVERLAAEVGVEVACTEIVGPLPRAALPDGLAERIRLFGFDAERQVIEELL